MLDSWIHYVRTGDRAMTPRFLLRFSFVVGAAGLAAQQPTGAWDAVARVLGKPIPSTAEAYRATFPRSALHMPVGTVPVQPAPPLTSEPPFPCPPHSRP